ncbi:MAG: 50S ribosomal protein L13 [Candidatus Marsarchaeota archaeon]|jgi:large subunit ribosomal protein L13|nr:50S ribosomal protein L13 [Candidatus Marsarchaeota archaeon]MCL5112209.1 50S ribosomal protein L13 [Candidatus Marsarchaeota archaeon]
MSAKAKEEDYIVYDATEKVLGRLATGVAKQLLSGKKVAVVNAESAIITGSPKVLAAKYKTRLDLQDKANPEHSPYWSRRPDMLVKRVIRGMLPYHRPKGKSAYRLLKVYMGVPEELKGAKRVEYESKDPDRLYVRYTKISELSKALGYRKFERINNKSA